MTKSLKQQVLSTMKSTDTEGSFELYATRTPGYLWALLFKALGVHPIAVTLLSIVIGCASGYFFYLPELGYNVVGMLLLVWADWLDCADGQLARMTGKKTLIGRILDGFAGDTWFFCIYVSIALRLTPEWGLWIWALVCWAGFYCHARQCSLADYYRNAHLYYIGCASELDKSADIREQYAKLRWRSKDWFEKLYLYFYANYTRSQEKPTPEFQRFHTMVHERYGTDVPSDLRQRYRQLSRPLMPLCQILTFDARVGIMFLCFGIGLPWLYPALEITVFELLRIYTNKRHERLCKELSHSY